jgi:Amidase
LAEQALEAAKAADRRAAEGGDLPRLHGVPFTIKGSIDLAGTPTTQGLKALAGAYPLWMPPRRAAEGCRGDPDRPHEPGQLHGPLALW